MKTTGQLQIDEDGYASKARRQKTAEDVMHYSGRFPFAQLLAGITCQMLPAAACELCLCQ